MGYLNPITAGAPGVEDRSLLQPQIETLVRKQVQQMRDTLKSGLPG